MQLKPFIIFSLLFNTMGMTHRKPRKDLDGGLNKCVWRVSKYNRLTQALKLYTGTT